jgi:hypothetical protein
LSDKQNFVQREGSELYTMEQQKQRLENDLHHAESRVMKSCIRNRAQVHITAAREEYERARQMMGKQPSEKPLQVFSVSSAAFDHLTRGKKHKVQGALRKGFSTTVKTGIPALRDVLMAITWGIRQPNARSFNEDVESCLTRLKLWSADSASEHKMAVSKRAIVEGRMDAEIKRLEQVRFTSMVLF